MLQVFANVAYATTIATLSGVAYATLYCDREHVAYARFVAYATWGSDPLPVDHIWPSGPNCVA